MINNKPNKYHLSCIRSLTMIIIITFILTINNICTVQAYETKGRITVYSLDEQTKSGTTPHYGVCASGNKNLFQQYIIVYQRTPDDKKGDCIGIFKVEDTGCDDDVIDIWCPKEWQQMIINKTYENECNGKIWIKTVTLD